MKKTITYNVEQKTVKKEIEYIPARYIIAVLNLDYRSLVHHFENGVWMYGCEAVNMLNLHQCCR